MASCKRQTKSRVQKRLAGSNPEGDRTFELLMNRFDTVDKDNQEIKTAFQLHVVEDLLTKGIVAQHKTYWGIAIKSLLSLIAGGFAVFIVWLTVRLS